MAKIYLNTEDCARVGDYLYFISYDYNMIFNLNIYSGVISIVDSLPEEDVLVKQLGSKIVVWKNELIFAPMNANSFWIYNLDDKEWRGYKKKKYRDWDKPNSIFQATLYGDRIFFMGSNYPAVVIMDLNSEVFEYIEAPYERYKKVAEQENDCFFRTDSVQIGKYLYWASCILNEVFRFDMETYKFNYITVGECGNKYSGIGFDGKYFWLSPRKSTPAIRWDGKEELELIELPFKQKDSEMPTIGNVICKNNKVYFASRFIEESFVIEDNLNIRSVKTYRGRYWFNKQIEKDTYVSLDYSGYLRVEIESNRYEYELSIDCREIIEFLKKELMKRGRTLSDTFPIENGLIYERNPYDLGIFLKMI